MKLPNKITHKYRKYRFFCLFSCTLILVLSSIIPIELAIAYYQAPFPQAILTLGGSPEREEFTAQFAKSYPFVEIWVSTGIPINQAMPIFKSAGISEQKVHLDYRAVDTVTNFTSLVKDFKTLGIQHIYLITSDYHIRRAKAIAFFVLGSQGIAFTPVAIPSKQVKESLFRVFRDASRAVSWIFSNRTGVSFIALKKR